MKIKALLVALTLLIVGPIVGHSEGEIQEVCMSPNGRCEEVVKAYILGAQETLDLAVYSLTLDDLAYTIRYLHEQGVKVRLIIDKTQAAGRYADDEFLEDAGVPVKRMRSTKSGLMHHKFAIIDGMLVLSGSYNWTKGGSFKNAENLIVFSGDDVPAFIEEFEKLWNHQTRSR